MSRFYFFLTLILIAFFSFQQLKDEHPQVLPTSTHSSQTATKKSTSSGIASNSVLVSRVIDGDTIELETGKKVRYIGINSPESTKTHECFGSEASERNRELVEGKYVTLEKDVSETDKYGRLLRFVYVDGNFINLTLVEEGYAQVSTFPPDVSHQQDFLDAQKRARESGRGLWGTCKSGKSQSQSSNSNISLANNSCNIKGNINSSGEKIYHIPDGAYYDKTIIGDRAGEQYFCSEEEAVRDGFRKSTV